MDPMTIMAIMSIASQAIPAISGMMGGGATQSGYSKNQRDAIRRQSAYQEASVNPQHPWAQALSGTIKEMLQRQAAEGVSNDMLQRRRAIAAGNVPAGIDASRRDEARQGALQTAFMNSGVQAQQIASNELARAAGQSNPQIAGFSNLADMDILSKQTNQQNKTNGMSSIASILPGLLSLFSGFGGGGGSYGGTSQGMMLRNPTTGMLGGGV